VGNIEELGCPAAKLRVMKKKYLKKIAFLIEASLKDFLCLWNRRISHILGVISAKRSLDHSLERRNAPRFLGLDLVPVCRSGARRGLLFS
jgi:hypothetical protein